MGHVTTSLGVLSGTTATNSGAVEGLAPASRPFVIRLAEVSSSRSVRRAVIR